MITYRPSHLRQSPGFGSSFALRSWAVGTICPPEIISDWLQRLRADALTHLTDSVQIIERTFGLSALRTRTITGETLLATVPGLLQHGAGQVNASESTQQGGVRRSEGYSLRVPFGTQIPTTGYVIVRRGCDTFTFEITGHDPLRSNSILLTVWIAATIGISS